MTVADPRSIPLARNMRRVGHLDLPGAGQVTIAGDYAYIGHITNEEGLGTSILDISNPRAPRVLATIMLDDPTSHSHKARVAGDLMIVNVERNQTKYGRKVDAYPVTRARLRELLGREPSGAELAEKLGVAESDLPALEAAAADPYERGGFKLYDVSDRTRPRPIGYQKTGGIGVHRFDMDEHYAYISTEMDGYIGNILVIYDLADPTRPAEVSRWWMPGQHVAGGETPFPQGRQRRLHHALRFGDEMWASVWHAGFRVIDVSDIRAPRTVAEYNYHPPFPEPTHTAMPIGPRIGGRRVAVVIDEEDAAHSHAEIETRRGRPHASLWTFDVTDYAHVQQLAMFEVSELDSPFSRAGGRFGAHQFAERNEGTLVYATWFGGGLRIIDVADPVAPQEVAYFIPEPVGDLPAPQSNDVDVDARGLIYLGDRWKGFDILEMDRA